MRTLMAKDYKLITAILGVAMRILFAWQRRAAKKAGHPGAKTAAVVFVQRFGGALNLNVHFHVLLPDAVFVPGQGDTFKSVPLPPPEDPEVLRLVQKLARRVTALVDKRCGTIDEGEGEVLDGAIGEAMSKLPTLSLASDDSEDQDNDDGDDGHKAKRARRCAAADGFSIHANTAVAAQNRLGLEKLCRYGMRVRLFPPAAESHRGG